MPYGIYLLQESDVMKKDLTCRIGGVRDTSTGRIYSAEEVKKDPALKKYIEKKINENINRAISVMN